MATPALAGNRLFIRTGMRVHCIQSAGHQVMLDFGQVLAEGVPTFNFPGANSLNMGSSPAALKTF